MVCPVMCLFIAYTVFGSTDVNEWAERQLPEAFTGKSSFAVVSFHFFRTAVIIALQEQSSKEDRIFKYFFTCLLLYILPNTKKDQFKKT